MTNVSVRLGTGLLRELRRVEDNWQSDRSETIRRLLYNAVNSWKIEKALEDLRNGRATIGSAAKEAGVSIWEMIELAKGIDWIGYSKGDLERDLKLLEGKD